MSWFRRRRPLTCQEVVELVSDYLEDTLPTSQRARFEHHLQRCAPCVGYVDQIRTTVALMRSSAPDTVDPATTDHLIALYRTWQHE